MISLLSIVGRRCIGIVCLLSIFYWYFRSKRPKIPKEVVDTISDMENEDRIVICIVGPPGAGKSYMSKKLESLHNGNCTHINCDKLWFIDCQEDPYKFSKQLRSLVSRKKKIPVPKELVIVDGAKYKAVVKEGYSRSDFIIHINSPIWICFLNIIFREFNSWWNNKLNEIGKPSSFFGLFTDLWYKGRDSFLARVTENGNYKVRQDIREGLGKYPDKKIFAIFSGEKPYPKPVKVEIKKPKVPVTPEIDIPTLIYNTISKDIEKFRRWIEDPKQSWVMQKKAQELKRKCEISDVKNVTPEYVIDVLKQKFNNPKNVKKFVNTLKQYGINFTELANPIQAKFVFDPDKFVIYGCPTSLDLDCGYLISKKEFDMLTKKRCDEIKMYVQQNTSFTKEIDLNLFFIDKRGNISKANKGKGKDLQNIIFETQSKHKQIYSKAFITREVSLSVIERTDIPIRTIVNFITLEKNSKELLGKEEYVDMRDYRKQSSLDAVSWKYYALKVLEKGFTKWFMLKPIQLDSNKYTFMKGLTMKIVQALQKRDNMKVSYTKPELGKASAKWFKYSEGIKYFLMRGKDGNVKDAYHCLPEILRIIKELINSPSPIKWESTLLDTSKNPVQSISNEIWEAFIDSPIICTEEFKRKYIEQYGKVTKSMELNKMFPAPSTDYKLLPKALQEFVVDIDQRTDEWVKLITFYKCGKNTGIDELKSNEDPLEAWYHLIRGCYMEECVQNYLQKNYKDILEYYNMYHFTPATIGLLVEEKGIQNSPGASPDMIFMKNNGEFIVVEIKTMKIEFNETSSEYRRSASLAIKQCERVITDITSLCIGYLVVMAYPCKNKEWKIYHYFNSKN